MMNNRKTGKKMMMRGFMCDSMAATAVCTMSDPAAGSVIVARRPHRTTLVDDEKSRLMKVNARYSRLGIIEPPRSQRSVAAAAAYKRSVFLPSSSTKREDNIIHQQLDQKPKPTETSTVLASSSEQVLQEVVMRVSLHCQGCAGKVKKHLSKMEGVTSFSIDLETKRVIVTGHVSAVGVLESISKVKKAEFWPS